MVTLAMRIKLLLLNRGFYSVRVIQDLITCELPFVMPEGECRGASGYITTNFTVTGEVVDNPYVRTMVPKASELESFRQHDQAKAQ